MFFTQNTAHLFFYLTTDIHGDIIFNAIRELGETGLRGDLPVTGYGFDL